MSEQQRRRRRRSSKSKSKSRSSSFSSQKKRSGIRTFIETVMGISIAAVLIGFGVWYFFVREAPTTAASPIAEKTMQDNVVDDEAGFETIRDSGVLENQLNLLRRLDEWPREAVTPVRLDTLGKRLELAQKVQEHPDLDEENRVSNAQRILESMGQIYGIALTDGIDSDGKIVSQYINVCNAFVNDSNPDVAREARLAKAKALVYESTDGDFETRFDTIQDYMLGLVDSYPNNELIASTIKALTLQLEARDKGKTQTLMRNIISKYDAMSVTSVGVVNQLRTIKDEILLEDSGIGILAKEALETGVYDSYLEKLYELAEQPDTGVELVNRVYSAVAYFEARGEHQIALSILEKLKGTVSSRQDTRSQQHTFRVSQFGMIRNKAVGKPFDFSDLNSEGEPVDLIQFSDRPVLLFYYSPNNPNSRQQIQNISNVYNLIARTGIRVIAVAVEESKTDNVPIKLNREWVNIQSSPPPGRTSEIFKRCPVTSVPYFAVVNHDGILEKINISAGSIKTIFEDLAAKHQASINN